MRRAVVWSKLTLFWWSPYVGFISKNGPKSSSWIFAVRRRYRHYEIPVSISTFCRVSVFADCSDIRPDGSSGPFICKECGRWSECRNGIATEFLCGASRVLSSFRFYLVPIGINLFLWRELDSLVSKISFCASHFFCERSLKQRLLYCQVCCLYFFFYRRTKVRITL